MFLLLLYAGIFFIFKTLFASFFFTVFIWANCIELENANNLKLICLDAIKLEF